MLAFGVQLHLHLQYVIQDKRDLGLRRQPLGAKMPPSYYVIRVLVASM